MSDKTKKIVTRVSLGVVALGTIGVVVAGGDPKTVAGIVTLASAAVTAVSAVILAILK